MIEFALLFLQGAVRMIASLVLAYFNYSYFSLWKPYCLSLLLLFWWLRQPAINKSLTAQRNLLCQRSRRMYFTGNLLLFLFLICEKFAFSRLVPGWMASGGRGHDESSSVALQRRKILQVSLFIKHRTSTHNHSYSMIFLSPLSSFHQLLHNMSF